jgi:hypothetical protein
MKRDENGNLVFFRVGKERDRKCAMFEEVVTVEEQKEKLPVLKTLPYDKKKGQGNTVFLEKDQVWPCIMAAIDRVELNLSSIEWVNAATKVNNVTLYNELGTLKGCGKLFILRIPMPENTYILSNSTWIKQFGSGWQTTNYNANLRCEFYQAFEEKVRAKIFELINRLYSDDKFHFMYVTCVRQEPNVCSHATLCLKPSCYSGGAQGIPCECCKMELCNGGCGRVSHGGSCNMTSDEASEATITSTTKICPHCRNAVEKSEGCNHIHCSCGGHFCWSCNEPYALNDITEHYQNRINGCMQFDQ